MDNKPSYILGLDVSTKTIGIALFEDNGTSGNLTLLKHVTPKVKPEPPTKTEEQFKKIQIFEQEFLNGYKDFGISKVIIEEPLLSAVNVYTVATLLRFNGMISRAVYETLGIVPDFISSDNARRYGFPEIMGVRTTKKNGEPRTDKEIAKSNPVIFGAYPYDVDKKMVIWDKVSELEPQITWFYDKKNKLTKENFDMTDAYAAVFGYMRMNNIWG